MCGCAWPTIRHGRAKTKLRESGVDAPRTAVAQLLTTVIVSVFAHAHPLPVISAVVLPAAHERNFLGYYSDCFIYVSSCCCWLCLFYVVVGFCFRLLCATNQFSLALDARCLQPIAFPQPFTKCSPKLRSSPCFCCSRLRLSLPLPFLLHNF